MKPILVLTLAALLGGCVEPVRPPKGALLVRNCSHQQIVRFEDRYFLVTGGGVTPLAPGAALDDICRAQR